ncbi:MAG TPA: nucleoside triphosphate pyrophosphohydrolase [candidate division Zixibacteria bacterium]|nr:nucleoside triphosphate pyrophosphohydrolase [candidate division Zixibacteria bacterium]
MPDKTIETEYNKLIRDKIPLLIEAEGNEAIYRTIDNDSEYLFYLGQKFIEESIEFASKHDLSELADILELIYSVLDLQNVSFKELENIRLEKKNNRGGFEKRLVLLKKKLKQ